jgi:hypothetical protein
VLLGFSPLQARRSPVAVGEGPRRAEMAARAALLGFPVRPTAYRTAIDRVAMTITGSPRQATAAEVLADGLDLAGPSLRLVPGWAGPLTLTLL